jgi:Na+/proline symporter
MNTGTIVTFILHLIAMIGIGVICYYRTSSHSDYILGGRGLGRGSPRSAPAPPT